MVKQLSRKASKVKKKASRSTHKEPNPFKSKFEKRFFDSIPDNVKPGYEQEKLKYTLECTYKPDWKFKKKFGGDYFFCETKGLFDYTERRKMLAVKQCNPDADIRMVFMQDNVLYKGSKVRYSEWCELNGFLYHIVGKTERYIPKEWLEEATWFTTGKETEGLKFKNGRRTKTPKA